MRKQTWDNNIQDYVQTAWLFWFKLAVLSFLKDFLSAFVAKLLSVLVNC